MAARAGSCRTGEHRRLVRGDIDARVHALLAELCDSRAKPVDAPAER
jgi:hypothetical protein